MYRFINQYAKRVSTICQQVYKYDHITCHNKQISASTSVFTIETNDSLDFAQHVYRKQPFLDSTLDVEEKILLDNGHKCTPVFATSQLNRLPVEVLIEILLQSVIPSLTTSATSTAAQCSLSTQSASTLQLSSIALTSSAPLSASRHTPLTVLHCTEHFVQPTCNRFGDHLYLIDCRSVCCFCSTTLPSQIRKHKDSSPPVQGHRAIFKVSTNPTYW